MADEDLSIDMEAASDEIGQGLGLGIEETPVVDDPVEPAEPVVAEPAAPTVREAPKSWAKEKHEIWSKLPPEAQEQIELREKQILDGLDQYKEHAGFGRQLKEAVAPYEPMIRQAGLDVPKAVSYLLGAHQRLSHGTPESRLAAYRELGRNLGLAEAGQTNPELEALRQQVTQLQTGFTTEQQAKLNDQKQKIAQEVETFATDPKNTYFDECAEHITRLITAGYSLQEAYETAVLANPVTRAKEQAKLLTEHEAKLRENARLDAIKGRKAASTNVRTRDTTKAPTEPLGTMEDTMKSTLAEINSRTH